MRKPSWARYYSLLAVLVAITAITGCVSLSPIGSKEVPTSPPPSETAKLYRVEMHFHRGEPKIFDGKLDDSTSGSPITVQTALEASGAIDKYKRMDITVFRRVAETGRILKMPVVYQPKTDSVKVEQDYALHHGDKVVIKPVSKGMMAFLMDGMTGSDF